MHGIEQQLTRFLANRRPRERGTYRRLDATPRSAQLIKYRYLILQQERHGYNDVYVPVGYDETVKYPISLVTEGQNSLIRLL